MIALNKKNLTIIGVIAISVWMAFNLNIMRTNDVGMDLTLSNVEALARGEGEGGGNFPTCQKNKGNGDYGYIPFCVNGKCQENTWEKKGKLDVNYCSN